jgi:hypothetical protein
MTQLLTPATQEVREEVDWSSLIEADLTNCTSQSIDTAARLLSENVGDDIWNRAKVTGEDAEHAEETVTVSVLDGEDTYLLKLTRKSVVNTRSLTIKVGDLIEFKTTSTFTYIREMRNPELTSDSQDQDDSYPVYEIMAGDIDKFFEALNSGAEVSINGEAQKE